MRKYGLPIYVIGYTIITVATIGYVFNPIKSLYNYIPYLFAVGAALSIFGRFFTLPQSDDFRVRRLNNILAVSGILVIISAYLMFKGENLCILTLFISTVLDIYTSYRYPNEK